MSTGEIGTFSHTGPHTISYPLSRSEYGIISSTTHIKMVLTFWPGTGKHFISNAPCSSDDSVTRLIHMLHFLTRFTNREKRGRGIKYGVTTGLVKLSPSSYPTFRKLPVQKGTDTTGEVRLCSM